MQTSALSRPRNRLFTAILAALLAVPLLVVTAPPAAAAAGYELTWTNTQGTATVHDEWSERFTSDQTYGTPRLQRRVIDLDGTAVGELTEEISVIEGAEFVVNSDDLDADCDELEVAGDDAVGTCTIRVNFPTSAPAAEVTVESTVSDGNGFEETVSATIFRVTAEVSVDATDPLPVSVRVGDTPVFEVTVENTGAASFDVSQIGLRSGVFDNPSDCVSLGWTLAPGQETSFTCTLDPLTQTAEPHLRTELRAFDPPGRLSFSVFNGVAAGEDGFGDAVIDLQLDPSLDIVGTAEPDTILGGGSSTIQVDAINDGDVEFDGLDLDVLVDGVVACSITDDAPTVSGGSVNLGTCDDVSPDPGDEVTIVGTADYAIADDGTETYEFGPVEVDLTTHTDALSLDARYGVINETLDTPAFVPRPVLPLSPAPLDHLGGPAVLEVTVTNHDGNTDLDAVDVSTDLAGCADRTLELDGGESVTFLCDGPIPADGTTAVTNVTASAETGGSTIHANDEAELTYFGIELSGGVGPSWDGVDVEIPFVFTIANVGALPLGLQGAAWQVFTQYGYWDEPPADICSFESTDPLAVGDSMTGGCTLLAGDLVDGLSVLGFGVVDAWGEGPSSLDDIELKFDPSGLVTGLAEMNGKAFGDVEVELRLLDLLELPRAEEGADPAPNSGGNGGADGCEAVGALSDADVGDIVASATSDADGAFCFDDVPPGTYEIVVDTDVDADLDEVVVDGAEGFTTNSPATSEEFFVGFASAALGNPIEAVLSFSADQPVEADDPEPVAVDLDDDEELAATGGSTRQLSIIALLALLAGAAIFTATSRLRRPATQAIDPDRSS